MLKKRLEEIKKRKIEIRQMLETNVKIDLEEVRIENAALEVEASEIRGKIEVANEMDSVKSLETFSTPKAENRTASYDSEKEYRSAFYKNLQGKSLTPFEKRAMDTTVGSSGYAIPETLATAITRTMETQSALYSLVKKTNVKGVYSLLVADPSADATWHTENAPEASDDTIVPAKITFNAHELIKVIQISKAALTMTIDAFEAYLSNEIAIKMVRAIEQAIINGVGVTTPKGILAETLTKATYVTDVDFKTLTKAMGTLPSQYATGANFIMNRKTFFTKILALESADGEPIVVADVTAPAKYAILGAGVIIADMLADNVILLGNLNYYQINFQEAISVERNDSVGFLSGNIAFRGYALLDGKVTDTNAFISIEKA